MDLVYILGAPESYTSSPFGLPSMCVLPFNAFIVVLKIIMWSLYQLSEGILKWGTFRCRWSRWFCWSGQGQNQITGVDFQPFHRIASAVCVAIDWMFWAVLACFFWFNADDSEVSLGSLSFLCLIKIDCQPPSCVSVYSWQTPSQDVTMYIVRQ